MAAAFPTPLRLSPALPPSPSSLTSLSPCPRLSLPIRTPPPTSPAAPSGVDGGGPGAAISAALASTSRRFQHLLDRSTPHVGRRWLGLAGVTAAHALRVWFAGGYYIFTYALGIYILNLLIAFLSPQVDPEVTEILGEGPALPTRSSDEFRPFVRRLPEFKFWL